MIHIREQHQQNSREHRYAKQFVIILKYHCHSFLSDILNSDRPIALF